MDIVFTEVPRMRDFMASKSTNQEKHSTYHPLTKLFGTQNNRYSLGFGFSAKL